ncbi:MAG TPA: EAL domain-containing protein, partial [Acidimicrobiales bacterium]
AISRLGIQLTVDDMGSDWSSLENLQHFAVNTMKIDGSLIDGIDHAGGVNRAIVETIVKVSHSLDLCTVAEAVETAAQVAILRAVGADVGQGYFFAPPLAADEAFALTSADTLPLFSLTTSAAAEAEESDPSVAAPESVAATGDAAYGDTADDLQATTVTGGDDAHAGETRPRAGAHATGH